MQTAQPQIFKSLLPREFEIIEKVTPNPTKKPAFGQSKPVQLPKTKN
jgi:hypothetical protein